MNSTPRRRYRQISPRSTRKRPSNRTFFQRAAFDAAFASRRQAGGSSSAAAAAELPAWKRAFDISIVIALLPLLMMVSAVVYCWIRMVSPGSVLFTQDRMGRNGKIFKIYKFRSMIPNAPTALHDDYVAERMRSGGPMTKLDLTGDPRLIKGGRLMRMSGLDELPQLINVLCGEMSLVGPRPCTLGEYAVYRADERRRFSVHPGLTGLWQIRRDPTTTFLQMIELDDDYVRRRSFMLDAAIILRTPGSLFLQMRDGCGEKESELSTPGLSR